jgi:sugar lactone lactonase YvrE
VSNPEESKKQRLLQRLKDLGLPAAAAVGAFSSLTKAEPPKAAQPAAPLVQIDLSKPFSSSYKYSLSLVLGKGSSLFSHGLTGIAVDAADRIYVLSDGQISIFNPGGDLVRKWKAPEGATCLAVNPDKKVLIGIPGRVAFYNNEGKNLGGFTVGETGKPASITSIKAVRNEILIADATARHIRRFNLEGRQIGELGIKSQPGFMLPNRSFDIAVDAQGVIWATDPGRHRVSSWNSDGVRIGHFGKFGQQNVADFVGCCNPVNLAIAPDGKIITGEKVKARVKVFGSDGKLLALIGPEHFDQKAAHLYLAVDSKGRIIIADPVRLDVKIFSPAVHSEVRKSL